jgi:hypothetical protein
LIDRARSGLDLEATSTREQVGAIFLFRFASHEPIGVRFTTLFATFVSVRRLFPEHFFLRWDFSAALGDANTDGFARRFFFAPGNEGQKAEDDHPEKRRARQGLHDELDLA